MDAHSAASNTYSAFATAVRRLVLTPAHGHVSRRQISISSKSPATAQRRRRDIFPITFTSVSSSSSSRGSSSYSSLSSSSSYITSTDLPVYASLNLQDLVAQRMSEGVWPQSAIPVSIIDDLPLPYTRPPPPKYVPPQEATAAITACATKVPVVTPSAKHSPQVNSARVIRSALSRGNLDLGMLLYSQRLHSMTKGTTFLPPSGRSPLQADVRRFIRGGEILRAEDFEDIIVELRHIFSGRRRLERSTIDSRHEWRPEGLSKAVSTRDIPDSVLAAFAMGGTFDGCVEAGYQPSSRMAAMLLSSFSHVLTARGFFQAVELALDCRRANAIDLDVLTAIIVGCGRVGQPNAGQDYLATFVASQPENGGDSDCLRSGTGQDADLVGWSHDGVVWEAIIRSYGLAGQHQIAADWLRRYSDFCRRTNIPPQIKPQPSASVYLTLLTSLTARPASGSGVPRDMFRGVADVLSLMKESNVKPNAEMLNFLANFEGRRGDDASSRTLLSQIAVAPARLFQKGVRLGPVERRGWDSYTFRKAFELLAKSREPATAISLCRELSVSSPRSLLASLLTCHHEKTRGHPQRLSVIHPETLMSAIKACLAVRDYPAAIVALQTFTVCALHFDAARAYVVVTKGIHKYGEYISPLQMQRLLREADAQEKSPNVFLQGLLEAVISHELSQEEHSAAGDAAGLQSPQSEWLRAASESEGEQPKHSNQTERLRNVMDDARRELLPSKRWFVNGGSERGKAMVRRT